ncbi:MAG: tetratricopeptide repeat protein [Phycisphaerae bacterium]
MPKNLTLISITLLLLLSSGLYSALGPELQAAKEQACQLIDGGNYSEASAAIESLISQHSKNPDLPEALYWAAERYRWAHKWQDARDLYGRIKQNYPEHEFASWADLGLARIEVLSAVNSRNFMKAEDAINKLIAEFYDHYDAPETLYWLAREFGYAERHEREMQIYQQIVEDYPDSPFVEKARLGIARAEIQSLIVYGQTEESKKALDKMKKDFAYHPDLQDALYWIGKRYEWTNQYDSAKEVYLEVMLTEPDISIGIRAKDSYAKTSIKAFIGAGEPNQVKQELDKLTADLNGTKIPCDELLWIADRYSDIGQKKKAKSLFAKVINDCTEDKDAYTTAAANLNKYAFLSAIEAGDKDKVRLMAERMSVQSIEDINEKADVYLNTTAIECYRKGWALKTTDNNKAKADDYFATAILLWEKLITDFPNSPLLPGAYFSVALQSSQEFGDYAKAVEYYQKVVDDWPDFEYAGLAQLKVGDNLRQMVRNDLLPAEQTEAAIADSYIKVLDNYPDSMWARHAALRLEHPKQQK